MPEKRPYSGRRQAEELAIAALGYLARNPEEMERFLALSGIDPSAIRTAAAEPGFLLGVLDYVAGSEALLMSFAAETGVDPAAIAEARLALGGGAGVYE